MKIRFLKDYSFAHNGYNVVRYACGDVVETDSERLIKVAIEDGAAEEVGEMKKETKKKGKNA